MRPSVVTLILVPLLLAVALVMLPLLISSCTDDAVEDVPEAPVARSAAPRPGPSAPLVRYGESEGVERGPGVRSGVADPDRPDPHAGGGLELHAVLEDPEVDPGEPVAARLELRNVGLEPIVLLEPQRDLAHRFEVGIVEHGTLRSISGSLSREELDAFDDMLTLAPGESVGVRVDLLARLQETPGYRLGRLRFTLGYRGSAEIAAGGVTAAWNGDPERLTRSRPLVLDVRLPEWLGEFGVDRTALLEVRECVARFQPGAPDAERLADLVLARGRTGAAALCVLLDELGSREPATAAVGGRALRLLRLAGDGGLEAARRAASSDAGRMALEVLEEDRRERAGEPLGEAAGPVLALGGSTPETPWLRVDVAYGKAPPVSYTLEPLGRFTVVRGAGKEEEVATAMLTPVELEPLRAALRDSRLWCCRRIRRSPAADEGSVSVRLLRGEEPLFRLDVLEQEARESNPLLAGLLRQLAETAEHVRPRRD